MDNLLNTDLIESTQSEKIELTQTVRVATIQERFAATLIDFIFLSYFFWLWAIALGLLFHAEFAVIPDFEGFQSLLFLSTCVTLFFLYYFILEGVAGATLGKFCTGLRVIHKSGSTASLFSILIRNLVRYFEIILFPLLLTPFMEATQKHQRLGDLMAGTIVVNKRSAPEESKEKVKLEPSSSTRRLFGFLIDMTLFGALISGYLLLLPPDQYWASVILINLSPLLILFYFMSLNLLFGGTPGKLLLSMSVCDQSGKKVGTAGNLIRTLFIPLDANPLSYLCTVLSPQRQRIGDIASGTLVTKTKFKWYAPLVFFVCFVIAGTVGYLGWTNPKSFMNTDFQLVVAGKALPLNHLKSTQDWLIQLPSCFLNAPQNSSVVE